MKINFDKQKSAEAISGIVQDTVDLGKKAAASAKNNVIAMAEKSKNDSYLRRLKKYNPLFPEQYNSKEFNIPNMIMIVDDADRRDVDVCEGSIGWLGKENGVEVLYLYDEAVKFSKIRFVPSATCDAIYYVDNFDRSCFIRTDCIFSKAHEERLAELKYIAYCLGAKRCSIEISESNADTQTQSKKFNLSESVKKIGGTEKVEQSVSSSGINKLSGHVEAEFQGSDTPKIPELKWFAHDDNVRRLIEMRCSEDNSIKTETLELSGSSSATMSQKTAYAIDGAINRMVKAKVNSSMNTQAAKEHHSKLLFSVEF